MADDPQVDEHGKRVWAEYKKVLEPRPHEEDFTRVRVGEGEADYEYVDPTTLFQLERLVPTLADCKNKSQRAAAGKGYPKYTRDLADAAEKFWPAAGYVVRLGAHLSDYDADAARAIAGADVLPFPPAERNLEAETEKAEAWLDGIETGIGLAEHTEQMLESVFAAMAPELAGELDPEVEQASAVPGA